MKVFNFSFRRFLAQAKGWGPDWERYKQWLKDRTSKVNKELVANRAAAERREHNEKVIRMNGLRKPKTDSQRNHFWED